MSDGALSAVGFPQSRVLPPCLTGAHNDDCDRIRADVAKNTGLEVAECGCRCHGRDDGFVDDNARRISELRAEVQRLTAELAAKDQALDEIKEQARRWLKIASTAGGPEDVAYNEGLRDCQGDISRILTRLDTQGETK